MFCYLGIRAKDTFVVVHPSESVGIICSICKRTFGTKKSLKRHYKDVHKGNPQANGFGRNKIRVSETDGLEAGRSLLAESGVNTSNVRSQVLVETRNGCNNSEKVKISKQKKTLSPSSRNIKAKVSREELKTDSKKKLVNGDTKKTGKETKQGKRSFKGKEKGKGSNEVMKTVNKPRKVLTGKKIVVVENKESVSGLKNTKKSTKIEKWIKIDKKKSGSVKSKDIANKKGEIKPKWKKMDPELKKVAVENTKRKELEENSNKGKPVKGISCKNAGGLEIGSKKNSKVVNKVQQKESKLSSMKKDQEETMPFKCDECGEGFRNMFNLKKHLPVHSIIKYHCYRCEDVFMNMRSLTKHLLVHEDEAPVADHMHRCRTCSQGFKTSRMLRGHMLEHERVEGLESSIASSKSKVKPHDSNALAFKGNQKVGPINPSLNEPLQSGKGTDFRGGSKCIVKNIDEVPGRGNLERVEERECNTSKEFNDGKQNNLNCASCQISFQSYTEFKDHVIECHINLGDLSLQCDKCSEVFTSETEVVSHLAKAHGMSHREARVIVRQKEREAVLCGSRAKVPISSLQVSCDVPSVVDGRDNCADTKICAVQVEVLPPGSLSTSLCHQMIADLDEKGCEFTNQNQQSIGIERKEPTEDCRSKEKDLCALNSELQQPSCNSLCSEEGCDLKNEQGDDINKKQTINVEIEGAHEKLIPNEADLLDSRNESCDNSKSLAYEKSCFLQEQESRDILQALFIDVEEESPGVVGQNISKDVEHSQSYEEEKMNNNNRRLVSVKRSSDIGICNAPLRSIKGGKHTLRCEKIGFSEDDNMRSSITCLVKSKDLIGENCRAKQRNNGDRFAGPLIDMSFVHSEDGRDPVYDTRFGSPFVDQWTSKGNVNIGSSIADEGVFVPFARRKASISGERRILEAINAGRKKNVSSPKRKIISGSDCSRYLQIGSESDNIDARGYLENSGSSSHRGKKRQQELDSEYGSLERTKKCKGVKPSKRRKRRWMFGKINKHAKRNRVVNNQTKATCEEPVLKQIDDTAPLLLEENQNVFPASNPSTERKRRGSCGTSDEVILSCDTAYEVKDCAANAELVDTDYITKQESATNNEQFTANGGISSLVRDTETRACVNDIFESQEGPLRKMCQGDEAGIGSDSSKGDDFGCKTSSMETSPLASLIYIPRRAAIAGQGKMQQANKSRKITTGSIDKKIIAKTIGRKKEGDISLVFSSKESLAKEAARQSQKSRQKSQFTDLVRWKKSTSSSSFNGVYIDHMLSSENVELCQCCSSSSCLKAGNGVPRSSIVSNQKKLVERNESISNDDAKKLKCDSCGKRFHTMYFLRLHEKRHSGDGHVSKVQTSSSTRTIVFRCKICAQALSSKLALANHMKSCRSHGKQQGTSANKLKTKRRGVKQRKSPD